jgi:hypothetical protein
VKSRTLLLCGNETASAYSDINEHVYSEFTIAKYLEVLFAAQGCTIADDDEDADIVVRVGKPQTDDDLSLIDNCWFLDL